MLSPAEFHPGQRKNEKVSNALFRGRRNKCVKCMESSSQWRPQAKGGCRSVLSETQSILYMFVLEHVWATSPFQLEHWVVIATGDPNALITTELGAITLWGYCTSSGLAICNLSRYRLTQYIQVECKQVQWTKLEMPKTHDVAAWVTVPTPPHRTAPPHIASQRKPRSLSYHRTWFRTRGSGMCFIRTKPWTPSQQTLANPNQTSKLVPS